MLSGELLYRKCNRLQMPVTDDIKVKYRNDKFTIQIVYQKNGLLKNFSLNSKTSFYPDFHTLTFGFYVQIGLFPSCRS